MMRSLLLSSVLLSAVLSASGCFTTREEGDTLRTDVDALKSETAQMQREVTDLKATQVERLTTIDKRAKDLEASLGGMRQSDADTSVQIERIVAEVQALRGEVEIAKNDLSQQKASVESILARPPVSVAAAATAQKVTVDKTAAVDIGGEAVPQEAKAHYEFAKKFFDAKKFDASAEAFDLFIARHPDNSDLVDNAAFWKAESYAQLATQTPDKAGKEKAYKQAILSYQRVLETPKSEKADGALYKIGLAFEGLGFQQEAKVFYDELLVKYPASPLIADAKKRMKNLKTKK
jgi:TolA-binding protein